MIRYSARRAAPLALLLAPVCAHAQCAGWLTSRFHSPGGSFTASPWAIANWDPDGNGPAPTELIFGGAFGSVGGLDIDSIVRWNGREWLDLGSNPCNGVVRTIVNWDPDGDGPLGPALFVGGGFTTLAGQPIRRAAMWDGSAWSAMGGGFDGQVSSSTTWDPDGPGPEPDWLVAGAIGQSTPPTGATISRFDDGGWIPVSDIASYGFLSLDLQVWDPDGAGPQHPVLVSAGQGFGVWSPEFHYANIISYAHGGAWQAVGAGLNGQVDALTTFDFDGPGPQSPSLVAGGAFTATADSATPLLRIARWDGAQWLPIGAGFTGGFSQAVRTLTTWDPDGDGPLPVELVAAGDFTHSGSALVNNMARWTGSAWVSFDGGLDGTAISLAPW